MISCIWRVFSDSQFNAKEFIQKHKLKADGIFEKGKLDKYDRPQNNDGFNCCVFEINKSGDLKSALESFLTEQLHALTDLLRLEIETTLDIGITVGSDEQYTCAIEVPYEIAGELARFKTSIAVSCYPCTEN
jgi:hypothetical protein